MRSSRANGGYHVAHWPQRQAMSRRCVRVERMAVIMSRTGLRGRRCRGDAFESSEWRLSCRALASEAGDVAAMRSSRANGGYLVAQD